MAAIRPSIPKGTRDFGPAEVHRRQYILNTIREVFELYGFQPIETPAMEQMSTLTGKYGEEGDKLLFRVLNSGDYLSKADEEALKAKDSSGLVPSIAEKGLRYDLTIPFARFVVQHHNDITFPFRRYQMQPVWRADRPQKGRYREFWQCDADCIGSDSLITEVELVEVYLRVFKELGIPVLVKLNHREFLKKLGDFYGIANRLSEFLGLLDKIDRVTLDVVIRELGEKGFIDNSPGHPVDFNSLLTIHDAVESFTTKTSDSFNNTLRAIRQLGKTLGKASSRYEAVSIELDGVFKRFFEFLKLIDTLNPKEYSRYDTRVIFDPFLARGLDYYTGTIMEVVVNIQDFSIGSVGGGGRYDNLTRVFGLSGISGVGISFGLDRIYDVLEATDGFPEQMTKTTEALVVQFEDAALEDLMEIARILRQSEIRAEIYPDAAKLRKQFRYADNNNIPWVITAGPEELSKGQVGLKNMVTGEQNTLKLAAAMEQIKAARQPS